MKYKRKTAAFTIGAVVALAGYVALINNSSDKPTDTTPKPVATPQRPAKVELTPATGINKGPTSVRAFDAPRTVPPQVADDRSPLADQLNNPNGTIDDDLKIVGELLDNYVAEFRSLPIGTNAEITATLAGDNTLGHAPLPADHPAISDKGELLDRWGTRFFFHQVSRDFMELRSAGPDRRHFSEDDIVWPEDQDHAPTLMARLNN